MTKYKFKGNSPNLPILLKLLQDLRPIDCIVNLHDYLFVLLNRNFDLRSMQGQMQNISEEPIPPRIQLLISALMSTRQIQIPLNQPRSKVSESDNERAFEKKILTS